MQKSPKCICHTHRHAGTQAQIPRQNVSSGRRKSSEGPQSQTQSLQSVSGLEGQALTNFKAALASADIQGVGLTLWTKKICLAKVLQFTETQASAKNISKLMRLSLPMQSTRQTKKLCLKSDHPMIPGHGTVAAHRSLRG